MNKLPIKTRVQILTLLCEGSSMRSISRISDVSINTVSKLLVDAGKFCAELHDREVRNVKAKRVAALRRAKVVASDETCVRIEGSKAFQ